MVQLQHSRVRVAAGNVWRCELRRVGLMMHAACERARRAGMGRGVVTEATRPLASELLCLMSATQPRLRTREDKCMFLRRKPAETLVHYLMQLMVLVRLAFALWI